MHCMGQDIQERLAVPTVPSQCSQSPCPSALRASTGCFLVLLHPFFCSRAHCILSQGFHAHHTGPWRRQWESWAAAACACCHCEQLVLAHREGLHIQLCPTGCFLDSFRGRSLLSQLCTILIQDFYNAVSILRF